MMTGFIPTPMGTQNKMGQPNQVFRVKDGLLAVSASSDQMWRAFCRGINKSELADDERFNSLVVRYENRDELVREVMLLLSQRTIEECVRGLEAEGVICAEVRNLDRVVVDPQLEILGSIIEAKSSNQTIRVINNPLHFSNSERLAAALLPGLGEHTNEVLRELGYSDNDIDSLRDVDAVL
jgi:crotonobetainyl-CoA:carnitine CoA-transferase CaiB-like acyl-CoA transferase